MMDGLAFLPLDDVNEGMKVLCSITPPNGQELIAYDVCICYRYISPCEYHRNCDETSLNSSTKSTFHLEYSTGELGRESSNQQSEKRLE